MKRRLFIGNLPPTVNKEELREKFTSLFSQHPEVRLGGVDVRCKNEDNFFGFVDVLIDSGGNEQATPAFVMKSIDLMNNTKWKGNLIKVQLAKESFLDKLKREREGQGQAAVGAGTAPSAPRTERFNRFPKKPDNFDFEIVSNLQPKESQVKAGEEDDESDNEEEEEGCPDGIPMFRGLGAYYKDPENSLSEPLLPVSDDLHVSTAAVPVEVEEDMEPIDPVDLERYARLQRLAGYQIPITGTATALKPRLPVQAPNKSVSVVQKIPEETPVVESPPISKGIQFNKSKQQNSDKQRQQSFDKRQEAKNHQSTMIKSSLAQVNMKVDFEEPSQTKKMKLFNDDDEEYGDEDFSVKKQYEGFEGQKLLELRGRWAFDDRFNIDDRFKEQEEEEIVLPTELEKSQQRNIVSDLLGIFATTEPKSRSETIRSSTQLEKKSIILDRFDPENVNDEINISIQKRKDAQAQEKSSGKQEKLQGNKNNKSADTQETPEQIRSTEPATYKVVSNLKSLFSEDTQKQEPGSFSLLASFGNDDAVKQPSNNFTFTHKKDSKAEQSGTPRQFWESNPFKYDSSDDEDDEKSGKNKSEKSAAPVAIRSTDFFFSKNDKRFEGLRVYYLTKDEAELRLDYDEKRRELRSIVKAKARNAKRKDEKRTVAIKRAIRKRRKYRKTMIKNNSSNSVKVSQPKS